MKIPTVVKHTPTNAYTSGDILLISGSARKSANTSAQSLLRFRRASFSHVAIILDPATVIHAMPGEGVHLSSLKHLLQQTDLTRLKALRHLDLDRSSELQLQIRNALLYFHNQRYNKLFFARIGERSSYCSELAAKAYHRIGYPLTKKLPRNTLPEDIAALATQRHKWLDVTNIYTEADLDPAVQDSFISDLFDEIDQVIEQAGERFRKIEHDAHEIIKHHDEMQKKLNALHDVFGLKKIQIEHPRQYWDIPENKPKGPAED